MPDDWEHVSELVARLLDRHRRNRRRAMTHERPDHEGGQRAAATGRELGGAPLSIIKQYVEQQREAAPPPRPERRGFRRGKN